jgi:hypothetical protein
MLGIPGLKIAVGPAAGGGIGGDPPVVVRAPSAPVLQHLQLTADVVDRLSDRKC